MVAQDIDFARGLEDAWSSIADFVPKLLFFLVVLFIGWIIAKMVAKALTAVLQRVGFNTLLDKAGANEILARASLNPVDLIGKLAYYFILLMALQLALSVFGPTNPISEMVDQIIAFLPKAFVAIVIVVIAGAVANAVKDIMGGALGSLSYGRLLTNIVGGFIVALGVIAALAQVGIGLAVTMPVLIAVLATISGILIVGVGGGLITPMRSRWEGWLNQIAEDTKSQDSKH